MHNKSIIIIGGGRQFIKLMKAYREISNVYFHHEYDCDLNALSGDVLISVGMRKKINVKSLQFNEVFNIHPAPLPKYRGMHSVVWSILNDDFVFGVTLHEVDRNLDTGPIIFQEIVCKPEATSFEVNEALDLTLLQKFPNWVDCIQRGAFSRQAQIEEEALHVRSRTLDDCYYDLAALTVRDFELTQLALVEPYPLATYSWRLGNYRFNILDYFLYKISYVERPGTLIVTHNDGAIIKLKDGAIKLKKIRGVIDQKVFTGDTIGGMIKNHG